MRDTGLCLETCLLSQLREEGAAGILWVGRGQGAVYLLQHPGRDPAAKDDAPQNVSGSEAEKP